MSAKKIRNSWHIDFSFNNERYRRKSPDNTKGGAQAYEVLLRQKIARGEPLHKEEKEESKMSFKEFSEKWFNTYVKNHNKISEINGKRCILDKHLIPFFGNTKLDKFSYEKIESYKSKKLSTGLASKTVNNQLTVLNTALRTAKEWYDFEKIPKIKKLKTPPPQIDFLTEADSSQLLKSVDGMWYEAILLALKTGLRIGELRGLRWEDINWENKQLTVKRSIYKADTVVSPKSNKERYIPLSDELFDVLYKRKADQGYIFQYRDKHLKTEYCRTQLFKICDKAGVKRVGWHSLRHSFASHLAMAGTPMISIKELMGHADIQTTMRYSHLTSGGLNQAINLLK